MRLLRVRRRRGLALSLTVMVFGVIAGSLQACGDDAATGDPADASGLHEAGFVRPDAAADTAEPGDAIYEKYKRPDGSAEPPDSACAADAPTGEGGAIATYDAAACGPVATLDASTCPTEKISFVQCKGCFNDSYVELCVGNTDTVTRCALLAIDPTTEFYPKYTGRVGCNPAVETLVLVPIDKSGCTPAYGAADDATWAKICALAALTNVARVEPTLFP
jgi:hypothetical protein